MWSCATLERHSGSVRIGQWPRRRRMLKRAASDPPRTRASGTFALHGAGGMLALLVLINLLNYMDRQVLAAVVGPIKASFFGANGSRGMSTAGGVSPLVTVTS